MSRNDPTHGFKTIIMIESPVHLLEKSPVHLSPSLFFANQPFSAKFFPLSFLLLDVDRSKFFFFKNPTNLSPVHLLISHKFKPSPFTEKA